MASLMMNGLDSADPEGELGEPAKKRRMKTWGVLILASLLTVAGTAEARGRGPRAETKEYVAPAYRLPAGGETDVCPILVPYSIGCIQYQPRPGEDFVKVRVADDSGELPEAWVHQNDGLWSVRFCGRTNGKVAIDPTKVVFVYVMSESSSCAGAGTSGKVTVTFY